MVLFWFASVSFMSVNTDGNEANENREFDYILIAGILPFFFFGDFLISSRINHMTGALYFLSS